MKVFWWDVHERTSTFAPQEFTASPFCINETISVILSFAPDKVKETVLSGKFVAPALSPRFSAARITVCLNITFWTFPEATKYRVATLIILAVLIFFALKKQLNKQRPKGIWDGSTFKKVCSSLIFPLILTRTSLVEATHDPLTSGPTESQHATAQRLLLLRSDPFHSLVSKIISLNFLYSFLFKVPLDQVSQDTEGLKILLSKGKIEKLN